MQNGIIISNQLLDKIMVNNLNRIPLIFSSLVCVLSFLYFSFIIYSVEITNALNILIGYLGNHRVLFVSSMVSSFEYVAYSFVFSNIFLSIIGRNMYTWNDGSGAKTVIDKEFKMIFRLRTVLSLTLLSIAIILTVGSLSIEVRDTLQKLTSAFVILFISTEAYWAFFKWNMARKADNCLGKSIDGRSSIECISGEMVMSSFWFTPFNDEGYYHYKCDFNLEQEKWIQESVNCIRNKKKKNK